MNRQCNPVLQAAVCSGLVLWNLLAPAQAASETRRSLSLGYSYTNNLEVQTGDGIDQGSASLSRHGADIRLALLRQSLGFDGGYTLAASGSYNKGISDNSTDNNDIARASLVATRLLALSPSWLARASLSGQYYDNQPLPVNSYYGATANATLGYVGQRGQGLDIGLRIRQEEHRQLSSDRYSTTRSKLSLTWYFPRSEHAPVASIYTSVSQNDASDDARTYRSLAAGAALKRWNFRDFKIQAGITWQRDTYDSSTDSEASPAGLVPKGRNGANEKGQGNSPRQEIFSPTDTSSPRTDTTLVAYLSLGYPLKPHLWWNSSLSIGQYRSSESSDNENFYGFTTRLVHDF